MPLVNLYNDQIIPPGALPLRMTAQSPCFRKERAAAGRDVRGIKRVKQFYKVEMVRVVEPEGSMQHLEELRRRRRGDPAAARAAVPGDGAVHRRSRRSP